jgi:hypothetical protein
LDAGDLWSLDDRAPTLDPAGLSLTDSVQGAHHTMSSQQSDLGYDSRSADTPRYDTPERRTFTETRRGAKTTELFLTLAIIIGVLLATYADEDSLARVDGWRFATYAAVAYIISRGLAKLATREPYEDR